MGEHSTLIPFAQVSTSKKQHYMRARLLRAGVYTLAVTVTDPVTGEPMPVAPHCASDRVTIVPGPLDAARTQISGLPESLTAGAPKPVCAYIAFGVS